MKHIVHLVSNKVWGGGEQYVYDLCQRLSQDVFPVTVVCRPYSAIYDKLRHLNATVVQMPLKGAVDIVSVWRLARLLCQGEYVIHAHNFKDALTAAMARRLSGNSSRVKLIITRHLVKKGSNNLLYRWLYGQVDKVVFVSELARQEFMLSQPNIAYDKTCVIHNSIALPAERKCSETIILREKYNLKDSTAIIMYHGRLAEEKGIEVLIEALGIIRNADFFLIIAGTGEAEYTKRLRELALSCGIADKLDFVGFLQEVIPYIRQCDFGVLPSIARESFSLACLEYMSQGKCVIASDNGGQSEYLISEKNGILTPPGNSKSLSNKIKQLIEDKNMRNSIGGQALNDFHASLDYNHFYKRIKELYV